MIRTIPATWVRCLILADLLLPAILLLTYGAAWSLESMGDATGGGILRTTGLIGLIIWGVGCFLLLLAVAVRSVTEQPSQVDPSDQPF